MHAIRHHAFGGPDVLSLETMPDLEPGLGQLRIAVTAAGVHLLDTTMRAGTSFGMASAPTLPVIPGREVAGVVDAVGHGVDDAWLGCRVVAHLGLAGGGYATQAVVDAGRVYELPSPLSDEEAVAAIGTGRTAAGILALAGIHRGETVAIPSAAGGLGVLLVQGVLGVGATAIGLAGGSAKVELVERLGAAAIDYRADGWIARTVERGPFDVVLDGVGGEVGQALYERLRPGGRLVRFGWSSEQQNAYDDPARTVVDVLGPPIASRLEEFERLALDAAADGSRVPIVGTVVDLADAAAAHQAIESRTSVGKVVLRVR